MEAGDLPHDRDSGRQEHGRQGEHEGPGHAETREGRNRCRPADTTLIHRLPPYVVEPLVREPINEQDVFESAKSFLEQEFGVPVHVTSAEESELVKAATALPFKPAIIIE